MIQPSKNPLGLLQVMERENGNEYLLYTWLLYFRLFLIQKPSCRLYMTQNSVYDRSNGETKNYSIKIFLNII